MWLKVLLEKFMDVAQSEQISRTVRIICTIFVSLVLILGIACLFLLAFLIEEAGLFRRAVSLILGIGILAYAPFLHSLAGMTANIHGSTPCLFAPLTKWEWDT